MQVLTYGNNPYELGRSGYQTTYREKKSGGNDSFGAKVTEKENQITVELPTQDWTVCARVDKIPSKYELKEGSRLGMHWRASGAEYQFLHAAESTEENPVLVARGVDENGKYFEEKIAVKQINPYNATRLELDALSYFRPEENQMMAVLNGTDELGIKDRFNFIAAYQRDIAFSNRLHLLKEAAWLKEEMDFILGFTNAGIGSDKNRNASDAETCIIDEFSEENSRNLELYSSAVRERLLDSIVRKCSEENSDILWEK